MLGDPFVMNRESKPGRHFFILFLQKEMTTNRFRGKKVFVSSFHTRKLTGLPFIVNKGSERRRIEQGPSARRPEMTRGVTADQYNTKRKI